jgi:hypothetical protein
MDFGAFNACSPAEAGLQVYERECATTQPRPQERRERLRQVGDRPP